MYEKCIVMEIKDDYAIVMSDEGEMIRVKIKKGMHVGDNIYVVPEDYYKEGIKGEIISFIQNKNMLKKALGMVVTVLVCAVVAMTTSSMGSAYAKVSLGDDQQLEFTVDENYNIVDVVSKDGRFSEEELQGLKGLKLSEIDEKYKASVKNEDGKLDASYEYVGKKKNKNKMSKEDLKVYLDGMFGEGVVDVNEVYEELEEGEDLDEELEDIREDQADKQRDAEDKLKDQRDKEEEKRKEAEEKAKEAEKKRIEKEKEAAEKAEEKAKEAEEKAQEQAIKEQEAAEEAAEKAAEEAEEAAEEAAEAEEED